MDLCSGLTIEFYGTTGLLKCLIETHNLDQNILSFKYLGEKNIIKKFWYQCGIIQDQRPRNLADQKIFWLGASLNDPNPQGKVLLILILYKIIHFENNSIMKCPPFLLPVPGPCLVSPGQSDVSSNVHSARILDLQR